MPFNTSIPKKLKPFFQAELENYIIEFNLGNLKKAWNHIERAHIIGQKYPFEHSYVHWKMLQFGFKIKSSREVIGQIPRLLVGGIKSFIGTIPEGNPGGSNVSAIKPFPINDELKDIFIKAGLQ